MNRHRQRQAKVSQGCGANMQRGQQGHGTMTTQQRGVMMTQGDEATMVCGDEAMTVCGDDTH